jgi:regulator of cell morphogenesis and NO signaling
MEDWLRKTVGGMVREDQRMAEIFERHAIDFCCNGGRTLEAACREKGLDPGAIMSEMRQLTESSRDDSSRPTEWDLDVLVDHIVNTHHTYVRHKAPLILAHLEKVVSAHGGNHPELAEILARFRAVVEDLGQHMRKEELVLFPHIKSLAMAERIGVPLASSPPFRTIRNPVQMMEVEHQSAGDAFAFVRSVSNGYLPPDDACTTYVLTYSELKEFEADLHRHVHLENAVLFPRAIELEPRVQP